MLPCLRQGTCIPVTLVAALLLGVHISAAAAATRAVHYEVTTSVHRSPRTRSTIGVPYQLRNRTVTSTPPFPYDCKPMAAATAALFKPLVLSAQTQPFPAWMVAVCPEVVAHFQAYPYFSRNHAEVPVITSVQAAHVVCTIKIATAIALHADTDVMLYAGSFVGALRHGGPVPWDDDVDLAMPYGAYTAYMEQCKAMTHAFHPDVAVFCVANPLYGGYIKMYVQDRCSAQAGLPDSNTSHLVSQNNTSYPWRWPFADIFLYRTTETSWQESTTGGEVSGRERSFPVEAVLPARPYYFGGLAMLGPAREYASLEYKWHTCLTGGYNHRDETPVRLDRANMRINCCEAAKHVPFVVREELVGANASSLTPLPSLLHGALS